MIYDFFRFSFIAWDFVSERGIYSERIATLVTFITNFIDLDTK